jgi:hypothetical protein
MFIMSIILGGKDAKYVKIGSPLWKIQEYFFHLYNIDPLRCRKHMTGAIFDTTSLMEIMT